MQSSQSSAEGELLSCKGIQLFGYWGNGAEVVDLSAQW